FPFILLNQALSVGLAEDLLVLVDVFQKDSSLPYRLVIAVPIIGACIIRSNGAGIDARLYPGIIDFITLAGPRHAIRLVPHVRKGAIDSSQPSFGHVFIGKYILQRSDVIRYRI